MTTYKTYDFEDNTTQNLSTWFDATCAADVTAAHDGVYGLLITPAAGFWGLQANNWPGWDVVGPVPATTGWSVWVKAETLNGAGGIKVDIDWKDSGNTTISSVSNIIVPEGSQVPTTWTKYTGSMSIPSGTAKAFVTMSGDSWTAGKIMLDTLVFGDLTSPPPDGFQIWNGTAWVAANDGVIKAKVWDGSAWI